MVSETFGQRFRGMICPHKSQQLEREDLLSSVRWNNILQVGWYILFHHIINIIASGMITKVSKGSLDFNFTCFLQTLESFSVWRNNLSVNIPSQIAALSKLQRLDLGGNNLSSARYKL
ncbi:hypothetical protein ACOSP7_012817 [Xanthoceras sorbifolium]